MGAGPRYGDTNEAVFCVVCGNLTRCTWRDDPYAADVNNTPDVNVGWWCDTCYQLACDEI